MDLIEYHKTTTKELLALKNKVRVLVDHWGEDGHYKEIVLKNIIKRFMPDRYLIGTGFVVKQTENRGEHLSSRQIDLIIYDSSSPVLFKESDFVILTPDAVRGIIEVKTNLYNQDLSDVIRKANENGKFIFDGKNEKKYKIFNGVFSYEGYNNFDEQSFINKYRRGENEFIGCDNYEKYLVNHVSFNKDLFLKTWDDEIDRHSVYNIQDLSFPFFISNLMDVLANKSVSRNSFIWFANDKELNHNFSF